MVDKNSWIDSIPACKAFTQSFTSECLYYTVFDSYKAFSDLNNTYVPTDANLCNTTDVFGFPFY